MPDFEPQLSARDLSAMLGSWRAVGGTLSIGLATGIAHLIESEALTSGARLPAQRALAAELEVARGTVTTAYEILSGGGYVTAEVGRGSTVTSTSKRRLRPVANDEFGHGSAPVAVDLSTQSLPSSAALNAVLDHVNPTSLRPYLESDGHTPYGLQVLRSAVARHLTSTGTLTSSDQILITAGAQQALWLTVFVMTERGDTVMVEDPTYRGILAVLASVDKDLRIECYPAVSAELRVPPRSRSSLVYLQSSVHSPTGRVRSKEELSAFAATANANDLLLVEDRSAADLIYDPTRQNSGLIGMVDPERLISVGTMSKLFWGGLRIGWVRSDPRTIARLADTKQTIDVTTSVVDQFLAAEALENAPTAVADRRRLLLDHLDLTAGIVRDVCPSWDLVMPDGGSGLWIDTHSDSIEYVMMAQARGIRIAGGPSFSATRGFESFIRLPVWSAAEPLRHALQTLQ